MAKIRRLRWFLGAAAVTCGLILFVALSPASHVSGWKGFYFGMSARSAARLADSQSGGSALLDDPDRPTAIQFETVVYGLPVRVIVGLSEASETVRGISVMFDHATSTASCRSVRKRLVSHISSVYGRSSSDEVPPPAPDYLGLGSASGAAQRKPRSTERHLIEWHFSDGSRIRMLARLKPENECDIFTVFSPPSAY